MMHQSWARFLPVVTLLLSCEKAIHFDMAEQPPELVVEATIESGAYPVVYLSSSLNFFSQISLQDLARSFVRNADITISDGSVTQQLHEYSEQQGDYTFFYYTADTGSASAFKGELGKSYSMRIVANGQEYTASTTIPLLRKKVGSLYCETNVEKNDSSKVALFARFNDPPGLGDYIRYFTSVNGQPYYPPLNSVSDDQVIDGQWYSMQIDRGVDRNLNPDLDTYALFNRGDSISVKLCDIDKGVFDFWSAMEYNYSSIGNPFSSPTRVVGNISNGALGYFGGYAVQYSSIVIPE